MIPYRILAAGLVLCASAVAGCGLGPGKDEGDVTLTVSRDYGSKVLLSKTDSIHQSDTVFRVLDRNADVTTRFGGGFVQSIDGLAGTQSGGRSSDWFFYVNGIESPIGSAQFDLSGGDRIWWDYRDWTAAMRVPAVVGSWPEPFAHGFQGQHWITSVDCRAAGSVCGAVSRHLAAAGAKAAPREAIKSGAIRLDVGTWDQIRQEPEVGAAGSGTGSQRGLRALRWHQEAAARPVEPAGPARRKHRQGRRADRSPPGGGWAARVGGHRDRCEGRRGRGEPARARPPQPLRGRHPARGGGDRGARTVRAPLAYTPGRSPLHRASPGAAIAYLGALAAVGFIYSSPLVLIAATAATALAGFAAGAGRAVRASLRLALPLLIFMTLVNVLVTHRGDTVLVRGWDMPVLGNTDITLESLAAGAAIGLRVVAVVLAFAVYSACVDPDRVLRALRPVARRSAMTAGLVTRMVPLAAADGARLREAAALRGPGAEPVGRRGHGPQARGGLARPCGRRRRDARAPRPLPRGAPAAAP